MSGGSMDYLYRRVEDATVYNSTHPGANALRGAFRAHLLLVAKALHDIEWVDSGDYGPGRECDAIHACFAADFASAVLDAAISSAETERAMLDAAIALAKGHKTE